MYGNSLYGITKYGQDFTISDEEIELYRPNLLAYITPALRNIREFKIWDDIVGYELGLLNWHIKDIFEQCFIDTATWGLTLWENEYAIKTDLNKSYEERREIIKAKLRGSGTTTKQMIKNTAQAFSGGEVDVIEHPKSYSFIVKFIGIKGIPKNLASFKDMLDTIKPAHLAYEFEYTYTVWNHLKQITWNKANTMTWNELKVYEDRSDKN